MQVDRTWVHCRRSASGVDRAQHPSGVGFEDHDLPADRPSDIHRGIWVETRRCEIPAGPLAEQPVVDQIGYHLAGVERAYIILGEWEFCCRTKQVRAQHMWISGVDHHRFDRFVQQGFWMVYQVGVQGIVACHQHHQRALSTTPGAPGLLPE
ncbi:Uncharacterised protein [Mycobacteroides abscessus subsp. massiliense]|nr:Uncharacterised protein [Mycobacteroides abscessus subsp. massiliense]